MRPSDAPRAADTTLIVTKTPSGAEPHTQKSINEGQFLRLPADIPSSTCTLRRQMPAEPWAIDP